MFNSGRRRLPFKSLGLLFYFAPIMDVSFALADVENPDGMIDLMPAPEKPFDGDIYFINDWDGGDADNQNAAEELNRNSRIKSDVVILSDLGVTIYEIQRTDHGPGGWGGRVGLMNGQTAEIKSLDISDLGLIYYLKTGSTEATHIQRNAFVSDVMMKGETLDQVNPSLITSYWEKNQGVPGEKADYL